MRYELKSIGIWAFIKIAFFLNMIVGFVFGFFYAMFVILFLALASSMPFMDIPGVDPDALNPGILLVIMPLMFSFIGAVFVTILELIVLVLYNLFSRFLGGLEFKLEPLNSVSAEHTQPAIPTAAAAPQVIPVTAVAPAVASATSSVAPATQPLPPPPVPSATVSSLVDAPPSLVDAPFSTPHTPEVPKAPVSPVAPDAPATEPKRADGSSDDNSDKKLPPPV